MMTGNDVDFGGVDCDDVDCDDVSDVTVCDADGEVEAETVKLSYCSLTG